MNARGVTLVELVMVIVLIGVVGSMTLWIITGPVDMYNKQAIRAELTDAAELALRRVARDIRRAVPNSVRVSGGAAIEMLNAADGARYRDGPGPGAGHPSKRLQFNNADAEFNVMGPLGALASNTHRLVIYNLGAPGADAYAGDAVITPPGTNITIAADAVAGEQHVTLAPGHQFAFQSPRQRMFVVDEAISYVCDGGILWRNAGYAFGPVQPVAAAGVPVTDRVSGCVFEYDPGTATRSGLITLRLSVTADGETVTLLHQVHVDNAP